MSILKKTLKTILLKFHPEIFKSHQFKIQTKLNWKNFNSLKFEPEILILESFFKTERNSVFFDIGANKGEYIFAAEKFLDSQNIHAFEPNPNLFFLIKQLFKKCKINHLAISDINGEAELKVPYINHHINDALGTLNREAIEFDETKADKYLINTQTLDHYCEVNKLDSVGCIKIDVEGFELKVLAGAKKTVESFKPILVIEIEKKNHLNKSVLDITNKILNNYTLADTYEVFYFDCLTNKIKLLEEEPNQKQEDWGTNRYVNNFIFVPKTHAFIATLENINLGLY
jgi:FkbM family methyltransferase